MTVRDSTSEIDGPGSIADHVLHTSGVLGIKEDLSTSALLLHAKRIGMGTSSAVADVVRQQALVDSKELQSTLQQVCCCCNPCHFGNRTLRSQNHIACILRDGYNESEINN